MKDEGIGSWEGGEEGEGGGGGGGRERIRNSYANWSDVITGETEEL